MFITLYNLLNSLDNTLEKSIKSYNNTSTDKFINELKCFLSITDSMNKLKNFPDGALFTLDRFEENFAVCESQTTGEILDIPIILVDSSAKDGDILRFDGNRLMIDFDETNRQQLIIEELFKDSFKK